MKGALPQVALLGGLVTTMISPAWGDADADSGSSNYFVYVAEETAGSANPNSASHVGPVVNTTTSIVCAPGGDQTCSAPVTCDDGTPMTITTYVTADGESIDGGTNCPEEEDSDAPPEVTPGMALEALRRVALPESELYVQPPGGRTLVNFETNFFTESGKFTRTVRLLGQRVELRIWPASFGWRFGDGETMQTASLGSPYPDLEITHRYLSKGRVAASVDTTYAADFRVNGGGWRPVNGTVTIPGTPEALRVVTARPVLVGGS